jgi:hypothetical protein
MTLRPYDYMPDDTQGEVELTTKERQRKERNRFGGKNINGLPFKRGK